MNQFNKKISLLAFLLFVSSLSFAETIWDFGLYYRINDETTTVRVVGFTNHYVITSIPSTITHNDIIYSVTGIGDRAFNGRTTLWDLVIPNSVTSIGNEAFENCTNLSSIEIPNSVTNIGNQAFHNCTGLTEVKIPNSVTTIGSDAFYNCNGLTSIEIPSSVTTIGASAFGICTGLTSVEIPNSITSIPNHLFAGCTGLTSVAIPNSLTHIGVATFLNCTGLTNIEIPNSVISIGAHAFTGCTGLTSVTVDILTPLIINENTFEGGYGATLYVPEGTVEDYTDAIGWKNFSFIEEQTITNTVSTNNSAPVTLLKTYNLQGIEVPLDTKGEVLIYIYSDGSKEKGMRE